MHQARGSTDSIRYNGDVCTETNQQGSMISASIAVRFKRDRSREFDGKIVALSTHACLLDSAFELDPDIRLYLRIPGHETIVGRITRVEKLQTEVTFQRALHPSVLDHILRRNSDPADQSKAFASGISLEFALYKIRSGAFETIRSNKK